jgi:hypothetical protein
VQLVADAAGDDRPLGALDLQKEVGELCHQLGIPDRSQVGQHHAVDEAATRDALGQHVERPVRQVRPLDAPQRVVVGVGVQEREGLHVRPGGPALEVQRVGLDAVEQRGGQPLADLHVGRTQILGEDGGGRAVGGTDVAQAGARGISSGDDRSPDPLAHRPSKNAGWCRPWRSGRSPRGPGHDPLDVDLEDPASWPGPDG